MPSNHPQTGRPRPKKSPASTRERGHRFDLRVSVRVMMRPVSGSRCAIYGWALNLNDRGMFMKCVESLPANTECEFRLTYWHGNTPRDIILKGWVVYTKENGVGVQFDTLGKAATAAIQHLERPYQPATA